VLRALFAGLASLAGLGAICAAGLALFLFVNEFVNPGEGSGYIAGFFALGAAAVCTVVTYLLWLVRRSAV
jgi:hypothetical protein